MHLRFDLAQHGRTREALELIRRILPHRRLARFVFGVPISGRLPWVLVWKRSEVASDELRDVILAMQPFMPVYGQYHAELALSMLGDAGADERAYRLACGYRATLAGSPQAGEAEQHLLLGTTTGEETPDRAPLQ